MGELGNMKFIHVTALRLMCHIQFSVFSLVKFVLQSQFPVLCIDLYLLDKQGSSTFQFFFYSYKLVDCQWPF